MNSDNGRALLPDSRILPLKGPDNTLTRSLFLSRENLFKCILSNIQPSPRLPYCWKFVAHFQEIFDGIFFDRICLMS